MSFSDVQVPSTIPSALARAARNWPDRVALDFSGNVSTFDDLDRESSRFARGLLDLGLGHGDRMCWMLDNCIELVIAWMAASKIGAIVVPLNTALKGELLRHQIVDSGARMVVIDDHYVQRLEPIDRALTSLELLIIKGVSRPSRLHWELIGFTDVFHHDGSALTAEVKPDDLAMLLYTSGTTGPSKGCMINHGYVCHTGLIMGQHSLLTPDDIYWTPMPLFHTGGCSTIISGLMVGCTVAIAERFSVSMFWTEIERSGATVILILSSMVNYIADAPETHESRRCYGQIRTVIGLPFAPAMQTRWKERFGVRYAGPMGYGMTECVPIVIRRMDQPIPAEASGLAHDAIDVRIFDDSDMEVPRGQRGEIVVRPRKTFAMFSGYWCQPQATVDATRNLWFHTGDLGMIDDHGHLYFLDRKKDYLRRGGENISSYEVEAVLLDHPAIADLAVHAVPSDGAEDEVKLTAKLHRDAVLTEAELWEWAAERLPKFATPRYIEFRENLPLNTVGKILKYELREEGVTPQTWDCKTRNPDH